MPNGEDKKIFRLSDIVVEEVSLVDRAANKRKFLIVKQNEGGMPTEIQPDGQGGFVAPEKTEEETVDTLKMSPASKAKALSKIGAALKALTNLASKVKTATGDADDDGMMKSIDAEMGRIGGMLGAGKADPPKPDEKEATKTDDGTETTDEVTEPATTEGGEQISAEKREELAKLLGVAADKMNQVRAMLNIAAPITSDEFSWQVGDALRILANHIKLERIVGTNTTMRDEEAPQTAVDADALISSLQETLKALPTESVTKSAETDALLAKQLLGVTEKVKSLVEVTRKQRAEIHALKSQPQLSRAATVDGDDEPSKTESDVVWPMDMADRDFGVEFPLD